jgi:peptidoglycan/xylan/chitin deacetylase (PgdA/CDA1 family)
MSMKQVKWPALFIGGVAALAILAGLVAWRAVERRRVQPVPILMYHHISAVDDSAWCVPTDVFERQMRSLRDQSYTSILPADLAAHQRWGKPLPRRPVIITFDDGYLDSLTVAEPILAKFGLCGIVYLITDCVGDSPALRKQFEGSDCLVWPEVRAMRRRGNLTFGGHAHTHRNLAVTGDPFPLVRECYLQIKKNAGFKPDSFCYPHGQYNERVVEAVRRAGFTTAMACEDAVAGSGPGVNLLTLPRVSVMGGRHRFGIVRAREKEAPGEVAARVSHAGVPLEVAPRLRGAPGAGWLPAKELRNGAEVEWCWTLRGPAVPDNALSLELWDKNRIFRLYP